MGRRTVVQIFDSLTNEEVTEYEEVPLVVGRRKWTLFLSPKSQAKFDKIIDSLTEYEESESAAAFAATRSSSRSTPKVDREQLRAIREWARATGATHNGKTISDRGRVPEAIIEAYNAAN